MGEKSETANCRESLYPKTARCYKKNFLENSTSSSLVPNPFADFVDEKGDRQSAKERE